MTVKFHYIFNSSTVYCRKIKEPVLKSESKSLVKAVFHLYKTNTREVQCL